MAKSVTKVTVNGMVGYCVDADTKEDALKMLELYLDNEQTKNHLLGVIEVLENENAELENDLNELEDAYDISDFYY